MRRKTAIMLGAAACLAWCLTVPAQADGPKGTATIKGKIVVDGPAPKSMPINFGADAYCQKRHADKAMAPQGKMVLPGGALPYAFVYIKSGISGKYDIPKDTIEIDQEGCMYKPHVQGMIAGQTIRVVNNDDTNHNIHSMAKRNAQFNFSQPQKGMTKALEGSQTFTKPEVMVHVKCDVHPWMGSYIGVVEHPFFEVTGKEGAFEIKNVPAGKYKLAVWHEEWGTMEADVDVKDGATVEQNFTFKKKSAEAPHAREVLVSANPAK